VNTVAKDKINILDESASRDCTGCAGCSLVCHSGAISMQLEQNGFYRPAIDDDLCTMCGVCPDVCYKFNAFETGNPFAGCEVVAVTNNFVDDMNAVTTVGVATRLAEHFYEQGYNVCGVRYDYGTDTARHDIAASLDDILEFRGSKYLPSDTKVAFETLVKAKKPSIVFGLPCQIHGLRKVIEKKKIADRFILVDLFCAGMLSGKVWEKHLEFLNRRFSIANIKQVNFKDKTQGWHKSSLKVTDHAGNGYLQNRFNDLFYAFLLRRVPYQEACYSCEFRTGVVSSDIRLGDFWGSKYKAWDDGVELMTLMNDRGREAWAEVKDYFAYQACPERDLYDSQSSSSMRTSVARPENYQAVLDAFASEMSIEEIFKVFKIAKMPIGGS
jgi:coenzyme F420-reducing hydrogenase beta subunit